MKNSKSKTKIILDYINKKQWSKLIAELPEIDLSTPLNSDNYLIHYAGYHNNINLLKELIKYDKNIKYKNSYGNTIGHIAALDGYKELLKFIIDYDITILNEKNNNDETILYIIYNDAELLEYIFDNHKNITNKVDINLFNRKQMNNILTLNIIDHNINLIELLLKNGTDPNEPHDAPPLVLACDIEDINIINLLLENEADINLPDVTGRSPLQFAVFKKNYEITKLLLEKGADYNYVNLYGDNFVPALALKYSTNDIIDLLLQYDINIMFTDKFLNTLGHMIFILPKKPILPLNIKRKIISKTLDLNVQNIDGDTIFGLLLINDNWKDYRDILITKKIDMYIENKQGIKIIDIITRRNDHDELYDLVTNSYLNNVKQQKGSIKEIKPVVESQRSGITPIKLVEQCLNRMGDNIIQSNDKCKESVKKYILNEKQSSPLDDDEIKIDKYPYVSFSLFRASTINIMMYNHYILTKYDDIVIPLNKKTKFDIKSELIKSVSNESNEINRHLLYDYSTAPELISLAILWHDKTTYKIPPFFEKSFIEAIKLKKRFVLLFLYLINTTMQHSNILLYDTHNNTIERFDPYGDIKYNDANDLDLLLEKIFKNIYTKNKKLFNKKQDFKYIAPKDYVKINSFQTISNETDLLNKKHGDIGGFCVAWCFWYLEMRLNNPNVPQIKLVNKAIKKLVNMDISFTEYIRNYANFLTSTQNKLLLEAGINEHNLYNKYFELSDSKKVFRFVIEKIKKLLKDPV